MTHIEPRADVTTEVQSCKTEEPVADSDKNKKSKRKLSGEKGVKRKKSIRTKDDAQEGETRDIVESNKTESTPANQENQPELINPTGQKTPTKTAEIQEEITHAQKMNEDNENRTMPRKDSSENTTSHEGLNEKTEMENQDTITKQHSNDKKLEKTKKSIGDDNLTKETPDRKSERRSSDDKKKRRRRSLQAESEKSTSEEALKSDESSTQDREEKATLDQIESEKTDVSTHCVEKQKHREVVDESKPEPENYQFNESQKTTKIDETKHDNQIPKSRADDMDSMRVSDEQQPTPSPRSRKKLPIVERPTFESQLTKRSTSTGTSVKLTCSYTGVNVRVRWFKDGQLLLPSDKLMINTAQEGITSLRINSTTSDDSGQYTCILSNSYGECESNATVTVFEVPKPIEPPKRERKRSAALQVESPETEPPAIESRPKLLRKPIIETRLRSRTADLGSSVQLMCSFSGADYQVKWQRNGYDIRIDGTKYKCSESDGFAYLSIFNVDRDDCDEYKCIVSNSTGQTESVCDVKIQDDGSSKMNDQLKRKAKKDEQNYLKAATKTTSHTPIRMTSIKGK